MRLSKPELAWANRAVLGASLHRLLVRRILGMTLLVCLLVAGSFYFVEKSRFTRELKVNVLSTAGLFQSMIQAELDAPGLGDHAKIQQVLDTFFTYVRNEKLGHSVYIEILDAHGALVANRNNLPYPQASRLNAFIEAYRHKPASAAGEVQYELVVVEGAPYLHILIPFADTQGRIVAYGESLFAIHSQIMDDARTRMFLSMALAVAVVLGTATLLFPSILRLLNQVYTVSLSLQDANLETLSALGRASAKRDSDVDSHSYRATIYAIHLGEALGLAGDGMRALIKGAFLHDVGKIGIRDELLHKPGRLTPEEFLEMRQHVQHGRDIVARAPWLHDALDIIGGHHERYDGTGYDRQLKGTDIPLGARIFALIDVFDALVSKRPYKEAMDFDQAMGLLDRERGRHFDPEVLDAFMPMAWELHARYAGKSTQELDETMRAFYAKYFSADIEQFLKLGSAPQPPQA